MAITSVVAVADNIGIDTTGVQLAFNPGDSYPVDGVLRLSIRDQPFPKSAPRRVVPSIVSVDLSYGRFGEGQLPPPLEPDEHWLRQLAFNAWYVHGSWRVQGDQATVDIGVNAALRDNTPPGEQSAPDDAFVAFLNVQALCIWTSETIKWTRFFSSLKALLGRGP